MLGIVVKVTVGVIVTVLSSSGAGKSITVVIIFPRQKAGWTQMSNLVFFICGPLGVAGGRGGDSWKQSAAKKEFPSNLVLYL